MVKRYLIKIVTVCAYVCTTVLLHQASCGIFSPRDSETPEKPGRIDLLNFSAIMAGTGQHFTQPQLSRYDDLFLDTDQVYYDFNSDWYSKLELIGRLHQIQVQDTGIQIEWSEGDPPWKSPGNDTIKLSGLKYRIFPDGDTSITPTDSGSSNFVVVDKNDWIICEWIDVPASAEKSFFAP